MYLFYYWVRSPEVAIARIRQRVQAGGHHVPDADVLRRYSRSVRNFLELYRGLADVWEVFDNTKNRTQLLAIGSRKDFDIDTEESWSAFTASANHDEQ